MAKNPFIRKTKQPLKLVLTKTFRMHLREVTEYGNDVFGTRVAKQFHKDLMAKIIILPKTPNIYARSRFIGSTDRKIYRNIFIWLFTLLPVPQYGLLT